MDDNLDKLRYVNQLGWRSKLRRGAWAVVYLFLFRPTPSFCMDRWRVFLLRLFGARIGRGCRLSSSMRCWAPWNLVFGDLVCIAEKVDCYSVSKIDIGNKVTVSQGTFLCTASHDIRSLTRPLVHRPIQIEDHAWICAGAFVGPGVRIGEGAVVAARGVVMKTVESWDVVAGNPAIPIKKRELIDA